MVTLTPSVLTASVHDVPQIIAPIIVELQLSIRSIPIILTVGSKDENRLDIKSKIHNLRFLSFGIYSKLKNRLIKFGEIELIHIKYIIRIYER